MNARAVARFLSAAIAVVAVPLSLPAQSASAAPCPDIEVVFARGTAEPAGLGVVGVSFVESVRLLAAGRSVGSYAVNYPASADFENPLVVARTAMDGIRDTQAHVAYMAATCPGTRIVLSGYSQGAVVAGLATMAGTPPGVRAEYAASVPPPMSSEVSNHVAAVVLFGKPSDRWMRDADAPAVAIGPTYLGKTVEYCVPGDTICDGSPLGQPNALHGLYPINGMTLNAAGFVNSHL